MFRLSIMKIMGIAICLIMSGCSDEQSTLAEKSAFSSVEIAYYSENTLVSTLTYESIPQCEKTRLLQWASASPLHGQLSFVTYAPKLVIKSEKFNVNFTADKVICNFVSKSGKWKQVSRKMNARDEELQKNLILLFQCKGFKSSGENQERE